MAKKCLGCGKISDSKLYACSGCLKKINEVRRDIDLKRRFKKDTFLITNKIATIFGIVLASSSLLFVWAVLKKYRLPSDILLSILYPSLIGFLIYFSLGRISSMCFSRFAFELYSDKNYYTQSPIARLRNSRFLKGLLKCLSLIFISSILAWFIYVVSVFLLELIFNFKLTGTLLRFKYMIMQGFWQSGFFLGLFLSLKKHSDWIKELEK